MPKLQPIGYYLKICLPNKEPETIFEPKDLDSLTLRAKQYLDSINNEGV